MKNSAKLTDTEIMSEFNTLEEEFVQNMTNEDIIEINETIILNKTKYYKAKNKLNELKKHIFFLIVSILVGIFSGIIGLLISIPLVVGLIYILICTHKTSRIIFISDILIGSLLYTKQQYLKRF